MVQPEQHRCGAAACSQGFRWHGLLQRLSPKRRTVISLQLIAWALGQSWAEDGDAGEHRRARLALLRGAAQAGGARGHTTTATISHAPPCPAQENS